MESKKIFFNNRKEKIIYLKIYWKNLNMKIEFYAIGVGLSFNMDKIYDKFFIYHLFVIILNVYLYILIIILIYYNIKEVSVTKETKNLEKNASFF